MWSELNIRDWCYSHVLMKSKVTDCDYTDKTFWDNIRYENGDTYEYFEEDLPYGYYLKHYTIKINGRLVADKIVSR